MIAPRSPSPFRDELASVQERLHHLEAENCELRGRATRGAVPGWLAFLVPLTTAWALLMTASLVRMAAREPAHLAPTPFVPSPTAVSWPAGPPTPCNADAPFH